MVKTASEESRIAEAVVTESDWVCRCSTDHHMVEEGDLHGLGGLSEQMRDLHVCRTRRRVSARMVVNAYNCSRGLADSLPIYLAGMSQCRRGRARGNFNLF